MNRKDFLRKGLLGTGVFVTGAALSNGSMRRCDLIKNEIDELKTLEVLGFNHIPNTKSNIMENTVLHKAETRGGADHGWLKAKHTFSFANYYNPERMHFGVLRVLNDDIIAGGMGFGTHPHDNMEIITIPISGDLAHKDSMGNSEIIKEGEIQVMSAGKGITHSEFNPNRDKEAKILQIWLFPNKQKVTPRYDQISLKNIEELNKFYQILSPNPNDEGVWIHQDAWFHIGKFDKEISTNYEIKKKGNGAYFFVIQGDIEINGQKLSERDGFGIWDVDSVEVKVNEKSKVLVMDVPMAV
jgi:redox-sensitive bicupin YhaK (pirin superfamily)